MYRFLIFASLLTFTKTGTCLQEEFQCKNGQCIAEILRCDHVVDCLDQSDEINCSEFKFLHIILAALVFITAAKSVTFDLLFLEVMFLIFMNADI